ncbi:7 transmembrane receptor (rhodopsin family) domain-containing protein [Ditylenchus destructor]|uniref:7 transmembrane receptor (Rhodopsin family) domain-containing protein n=1 Tax=Ditylenchus destructor TaxID=166010 RepID=A0AAD4MXI6_9BILA|nr:7 transmembrane receptor (rhodopsin family) domain-containing protein [Ditylenchus destructor]
MALFLPIISTVLSVVSIICNGLAKYIILTSRNAFSDPITIMVMTMAVSNGLYSLTTILLLSANGTYNIKNLRSYIREYALAIIGFDTGGTSHFLWPDAFCPALHFVQNSAYCIPSWIFVLIAIERFLEILSPRWHHKLFNTRAVTFYMAVTCVVGLVWSTPYQLFYRVKSSQPSNIRKCVIVNYKSSFWPSYDTGHLIVTYGIPLLTCSCLYGISSCILCLLNRLSRDTAESTSSPSIGSGIQVMIGLRKRTIKIMASSIGIFLLGYTLAAINTILILRGGRLALWLNDAGVILLAVSVSLGPFIFANFSYHFQQRVRELKKNTRARIALLLGRVQQWVLNQPTTPDQEPVALDQGPATSTEIALEPLHSAVVHKTVMVQAHSSNQSENQIRTLSAEIPTLTHIMTHESLDTECHQSLTWRISIGDKSE